MNKTATIQKPIIYPTNLPCDDGKPLETPLHRENMNVLIDSAEVVMGRKKDFFAGGNMFLYYSPEEVKNEDFRGPDFFLVKGVDRTKERKNWTVWEEDFKFPNIIIELLSETTYKIDLEDKKELYEQTFKTPEYYVYDPYNPDYLRGWRVNSFGFYVELKKNEKGWLWSEELNCWLGVWTGKIKDEFKTYLRMYNKQKKLVLLEFEKERMEKEKERMEKEKEKKRANTAEEKAKKLADKLRTMGINPDNF